MQIFVKNTQGSTITYEVSTEQIVQNLSEMICERENLPMEFQRIYFQGKLLKPEENVLESGLHEGSRVECLIPLIGGG